MDDNSIIELQGNNLTIKEPTVITLDRPEVYSVEDLHNNLDARIITNILGNQAKLTDDDVNYQTQKFQRLNNLVYEEYKKGGTESIMSYKGIVEEKPSDFSNFLNIVENLLIEVGEGNYFGFDIQKDELINEWRKVTKSNVLNWSTYMPDSSMYNGGAGLIMHELGNIIGLITTHSSQTLKHESLRSSLLGNLSAVKNLVKFTNKEINSYHLDLNVKKMVPDEGYSNLLSIEDLISTFGKKNIEKLNVNKIIADDEEEGEIRIPFYDAIVLRTLIDNAFTAGSNSISINLSQEEGNLIIEIIDEYNLNESEGWPLSFRNNLLNAYRLGLARPTYPILTSIRGSEMAAFRFGQIQARKLLNKKETIELKDLDENEIYDLLPQLRETPPFKSIVLKFPKAA